MASRLNVCSAAVLFVACAFAQPPSDKLEFEVASVKVAEPLARNDGPSRVRPGLSGGPGTSDPGRMTYRYIALKYLLTMAYDLRAYQIEGPAWIESEHYDIVAKLPPGTSRAQIRAMLQNLLKERFGLELKREEKEKQCYVLTVGRNGSKLRAATADAPPASGQDPTPRRPSQEEMRTMMTAEGPPPFPPGMRNGSITTMSGGPKVMLFIKGGTLKSLASSLAFHVGRPVLDETGLDGKYDIALAFQPETTDGSRPASDIAEAPSIGVALQQQLGLKLDAKKANIDMLIVLSGHKTPVEN